MLVCFQGFRCFTSLDARILARTAQCPFSLSLLGLSGPNVGIDRTNTRIHLLTVTEPCRQVMFPHIVQPLRCTVFLLVHVVENFLATFTACQLFIRAVQHVLDNGPDVLHVLIIKDRRHLQGLFDPWNILHVPHWSGDLNSPPLFRLTLTPARGQPRLRVNVAKPFRHAVHVDSFIA